MWMANTPLPLDMIFLNAEGIIVSIVERTSPFSTDIISSGVPATFALEVNAGEVSEKQIKRDNVLFIPLFVANVTVIKMIAENIRFLNMMVCAFLIEKKGRVHLFCWFMVLGLLHV